MLCRLWNTSCVEAFLENNFRSIWEFHMQLRRKSSRRLGLCSLEFIWKFLPKTILAQSAPTTCNVLKRMISWVIQTHLSVTHIALEDLREMATAHSAFLLGCREFFNDLLLPCELIHLDVITICCFGIGSFDNSLDLLNTVRTLKLWKNLLELSRRLNANVSRSPFRCLLGQVSTSYIAYWKIS